MKVSFSRYTSFYAYIYQVFPFHRSILNKFSYIDVPGRFYLAPELGGMVDEQISASGHGDEHVLFKPDDISVRDDRFYLKTTKQWKQGLTLCCSCHFYRLSNFPDFSSISFFFHFSSTFCSKFPGISFCCCFKLMWHPHTWMFHVLHLCINKSGQWPLLYSRV